MNIKNLKIKDLPGVLATGAGVDKLFDVRYYVHIIINPNNMNSKTTISISEARKNIFDLANEVQKPGIYYTFTEKGRPKAVLLSAEEFDSLKETMEILSDPKIMADIRKAEEEYAKGDYISWAEMKKELSVSRQPALGVADKGRKNYSSKKK